MAFGQLGSLEDILNQLLSRNLSKAQGLGAGVSMGPRSGGPDLGELQALTDLLMQIQNQQLRLGSLRGALGGFSRGLNRGFGLNIGFL